MHARIYFRELKCERFGVSQIAELRDQFGDLSLNLQKTS